MRVALSRRARAIVVDQVAYRWVVRARPTYLEGVGMSTMRFVAESDEHPGCVLIVSVPWSRPDNWVLGESGSVRPALVERAIRQALDAGWSPEAGHSRFTLALTEDDVT